MTSRTGRAGFAQGADRHASHGLTAYTTVRPMGFEPMTYALSGRRSNHAELQAKWPTSYNGRERRPDNVG